MSMNGVSGLSMIVLIIVWLYSQLCPGKEPAPPPPFQRCNNFTLLYPFFGDDPKSRDPADLCINGHPTKKTWMSPSSGSISTDPSLYVEIGVQYGVDVTQFLNSFVHPWRCKKLQRRIDDFLTGRPEAFKKACSPSPYRSSFLFKPLEWVGLKQAHVLQFEQAEEDKCFKDYSKTYHEIEDMFDECNKNEDTFSDTMKSFVHSAEAMRNKALQGVTDVIGPSKIEELYKQQTQIYYLVLFLVILIPVLMVYMLLIPGMPQQECLVVVYKSWKDSSNAVQSHYTSLGWGKVEKCSGSDWSRILGHVQGVEDVSDVKPDQLEIWVCHKNVYGPHPKWDRIKHCWIKLMCYLKLLVPQPEKKTVHIQVRPHQKKTKEFALTVAASSFSPVKV